MVAYAAEPCGGTSMIRGPGRRTRGEALPVAVMLALAPLAVSACSGGDPAPAPLSAPSTTATATTPAPGPPPGTSSAASTRAAPATEAVTPSATRSASPGRSPVATPSTRLPLRSVTEPEHGGRYWAVFVAVAPHHDPELEQAKADLSAAGYETYGAGSLDCFQGAREALGLPAAAEHYGEVDVLFADRASAERFARQLGRPVAGFAQVRTFCLD